MVILVLKHVLSLHESGVYKLGTNRFVKDRWSK